MSVSQQRLRSQAFFYPLAKLRYSDSQGIFDPRTLLGLKAPDTRPNRGIFFKGKTNPVYKMFRIVHHKSGKDLQRKCK